MNEATKKMQDDIQQDDLDVDQERKRETQPEPTDIAEEIASRVEEKIERRGSFADTAELVQHEIFNINDRPFVLPNQPAGVFAAISKEANKFIEVIMGVFEQSELAAMQILEKGAEEFGAEGKVAEEIEREAVQTIAKSTIPKIIELLAKDAPDFMAKIVAMILEPDPERIRKAEDLTYSVDDIKWKFAPEQQIAAIGFYIDSLNLGALKKKVRSFREA